MPRISIVIGTLLILLGVVSYFSVPLENRSFTALIPSFVGIILAIAGAIAMNPAMRKHAMHAAVAVALLGLLASLGRYLTHIKPPTSIAPASQLLMALLCGIFVVMGVRSFIAARANRSA